MAKDQRDLDREILRRARDGDREAVVLLYTTYAPLVRNYLVRMVGSSSAEDVAQEVFIRAFASLDRYRGESGLGFWLTRIAANCGARHLTRSRHVPLPLPSEHVEERPGPEQRALDADDRRAAVSVLERLAVPDRQILVLREVFGLSYEQIRQRLELRFIGTVRSRLHKARDALRRAWSRAGR
jgi:RNA polymerase sigma-70 factor (ECF subfamily)